VNAANQDWIVRVLEEEGIPILETPLRFFRTSPVYGIVDAEAVEHHRSYATGKMDSQLTCGPVLKGKPACDRPCRECEHQCMTRGGPSDVASDVERIEAGPDKEMETGRRGRKEGGR
jgi:hypothetical protein